MIRSIPTWNCCVVLLLVAVAAYFQTWVDIWPYWENKNATYTHGTLIALLAVWLAWRARPTLEGVVPVFRWPVLLVVLLLSAVWLLASRANMFIVYAMLWPILAFAILGAGTGWRAASKFAFPLAFLYFAIPIWDYLKPTLQVITFEVVTVLTGLLGLPVAVNGPYLTLPSHTIFIAEDCSGAHFLCIALAVGVCACVLRKDTPKTCVIIVLTAGLLSMIFNWLRILLIVYAYINPDLQHRLETMGHLTFGWWVFALDLVVFFVMLRFVPQSQVNNTTSPRAASSAQRVGHPYWASYALTVVTAALLPTFSWAVLKTHDYPGRIMAPLHLPSVAREKLSPDPRWVPTFRGTAWEQRSAYRDDNDQIIEVYANEYHQQSQGNELISHQSQLFGPSFVALSTEHVRLTGAKTIEAVHVALQDSYGSRWIGLYTYVIDRKPVASDMKARYLTAVRSVFRRTAVGVIALAAPCSPDCSTASAALDKAMVLIQSEYAELPRQK